MAQHHSRIIWLLILGLFTNGLLLARGGGGGFGGGFAAGAFTGLALGAAASQPRYVEVESEPVYVQDPGLQQQTLQQQQLIQQQQQRIAMLEQQLEEKQP